MSSIDIEKELVNSLTKHFPKTKELITTGGPLGIKIAVRDLEYELLSIDYQSLNPVRESPIELNRTIYENQSSSEDSQSFRFEKKLQRRQEFKITKGFTQTIKTKGGFNLLVVSGGASSETTMSWKSEDTNVLSVEETWSEEMEVKLPPHSRTTLVVQIYESEFDTQFTALIKVVNYSFIIEYVFYSKVPYAPLNVKLPDECLTFEIIGTYKGIAGRNKFVQKQQDPL